MGAAFLLLVYYLPIWFQAVKGVSAVKSGIENLPMILGLVIMSVVAGGSISALGYYTPFMLASTVLVSIGAGLLTTLQPNTGHAKWIGYQAITGIGVGMGLQQPMISVQVVLDIKDVPTGTALVIFMQSLGGALFVSIGQNIFTNKLISNLKTLVPALDPAIVLATGATSIQSHIAKEFLPGVTRAYNNALTSAYQVATAMACLTLIGSAVIEWKSVKGKKIEMGAA